MPDRAHDLVVYGASGFVGELLAAYLAGAAPAGPADRPGRAVGRDRLAAVRSRLPEAARDWPLVVADSTDPAALAALAAEHPRAGDDGRALRPVRPAGGRGLRPRRHPLRRPDRRGAVRTGTPSPAPTPRPGSPAPGSCTPAATTRSPRTCRCLLLAERARADDAGGLTDVRLVATVKGGFSGGTIDSMRAQVEAVGLDRSLRRVIGDPFALSPDRTAEPDTRQPPDAAPPARDRRRPLDRAVRHGLVQHPDRAPQQRRCRTGPTAAACATAR